MAGVFLQEEEWKGLGMSVLKGNVLLGAFLVLFIS